MILGGTDGKEARQTEVRQGNEGLADYDANDERDRRGVDAHRARNGPQRVLAVGRSCKEIYYIAQVSGVRKRSSDLASILTCNDSQGIAQGIRKPAVPIWGERAEKPVALSYDKSAPGPRENQGARKITKIEPEFEGNLRSAKIPQSARTRATILATPRRPGPGRLGLFSVFRSSA